MIPVALSTTQNLTLLIVLLAIAGLLIMTFAYYAFREQGLQERLEQSITDLTESVKANIDKSQGGATATEDVQVAFSGAAEYLKAMAELAEKLAALKPPVAALLISTVPFSLAAALLGIELLR